MLAGDLNARIGYLEDRHIQSNHQGHDDSIWDVDYIANLSKRSNKDASVNNNGKPFIESMKSTGLTILNGRTVGDIFGQFTCHKYNGSSVVDYICVSSRIYNNIKYLKIKDFTPFSDHSPVVTALQFNGTIQNPYDYHNLRDAPAPLRWVQGDSTDRKSSTFKYREAQRNRDIIQDIQSLLVSDILSVDDVEKLNSDLNKIIIKLASKAIPKKRMKNTNKNRWFDWECRIAKRKLGKLSKLYGKQPFNVTLRNSYYADRKKYKSLIKTKKRDFLYDINNKISAVKNLDWNAFKRLKSQHQDEETFDIDDLYKFYLYFNDLYNRPCTSGSHQSDVFIHRDRDRHVSDSVASESIATLNRDFTPSELEPCINKLKNNKSVSNDLISNEMIKNSSGPLRSLILKLFNSCLHHGIYPWNTSLTTPIHKKGDKENPDNYRAIAVGSCLGKLFSSLLLNRMIQFRKERCPDYPNQLGFCKGAQCSDHILTLKTLIDKYVTKKGASFLPALLTTAKHSTLCVERLCYISSRS